MAPAGPAGAGSRVIDRNWTGSSQPAASAPCSSASLSATAGMRYGAQIHYVSRGLTLRMAGTTSSRMRKVSMSSPERRRPDDCEIWPSSTHEERRGVPEPDGPVCCMQCGAALLDDETGEFEGAAGRANFHRGGGAANDARLECNCDSGTEIDSPS